MSTSFQSRQTKIPVDPELRLTESEEMWLMLRYTFLTAAGFNAAVDLHADERDPLETTEQRWSAFVAARENVASIAGAQMNALANCALQNSLEGKAARKVMCMILLSSLEQNCDVRSFCVPSAASALCQFSTSSVSAVESEIVACAITCLTKRIDLSDEVRTNMLTIFERAVLGPHRNSIALERGQIGAILNDTLILELVRPKASPSTQFCQQLLALMIANAEPSTQSLLKAAATFHDLEDVRRLAVEALQEMKSLRYRWDDSPCDQIASNEERAVRLDKALTSTSDPELIAQLIFNNMKGAPLSESADDRIYPLRELLRQKDNRVRIAACWAIVSSSHYSSKLDDFLNCIDTLTDLAVNSASQAISKDAITMINKLNADFPELQERVTQSSDKATEKFLHTYAELDTASNPIKPTG